MTVAFPPYPRADYFITEVVVPALAENGVPSDDITGCFAPPVTDPAFKASIVGQ